MRPILSMPLHAFAVLPHVWHELPGYVSPRPRLAALVRRFIATLPMPGMGMGTRPPARMSAAYGGETLSADAIDGYGVNPRSYRSYVKTCPSTTTAT